MTAKKSVLASVTCCLALFCNAFAATLHTAKPAPQRFAGFLLPIGGGASTGADGKTLKPAMVAIHRAALEQLDKAKRKNTRLPGGVCAVEYHENSADNNVVFDLTKQLFLAAGMNPSGFKAFEIKTREQANEQNLIEEFSAFCGLVFLPGGDQTEMKNLWQNTSFQRALGDVLIQGGGLMGKSAGAALLGSIGFFPRTDLDTSAGNILSGSRLLPEEFSTGLFAGNDNVTPKFLVETHAGDRERAARALALLSYWQEFSPNSENADLQKPIAIVVDSDSGIILEQNASGNLVGQVVGARAVEILRPTKQSKLGFTGNNIPFASDFRSDLLLSGDFIEINAALPIAAKRSFVVPLFGNIINRSSTCPTPKNNLVSGDSQEDARAASEVVASITIQNADNFMVAIPKFASPEPPLGEYAYLMGELVFSKKRGCGYWVSNSFNPDFGQPENRLNSQRFALASQFTDFSIAITESIFARITNNSLITFTAQAKSRGSGVFIYDTQKASAFRLGQYTYTELNANKPAQVGGWRGGTAHLLPPDSTWNISSRAVTWP